MSRPVFSVRGLSVAFRRQRGLQGVVEGVSFDLVAGETVALVGESGSGKSVTALALMGLLPASKAVTRADSIRLAGRELSELDARAWRQVRGKEMAMIFQEPSTALDPVFTAGSQIMRALRRRRAQTHKAAAGEALRALEAVGFPDPDEVFNTYPHQLSGGMRQLVMIAMAMVVRPRVLIADEPTTALDVTTQSLIIEKLEALQREQGTAILLVTHDLGVAARCCRQALVMYCGRLVEEAPYAQLFREPRHPYTRGLLRAIPRIGDGRPPPIAAIPGRVPSLSEWPVGCHFAARCERADDECRKRFPPTVGIGDSRVACYHPLGDGN
ncbi:MAG TPA: ABC transporter ATP-binding protein [Xanthomonadales bacterium]|nr:ABC transporter ATP-binding protein [Xanthomonadales bacterium]